MNTSKVMVEVVDIIGVMEMMNKRTRAVVINGSEDEKLQKAYDLGVENTMSALKSIISTADHSTEPPTEKQTDRLIYQKYGVQTGMVMHMRLDDVLKQLEESKQIHLAK